MTDKYKLRRDLRAAQQRAKHLETNNRDLRRVVVAAVGFMTNNPMPRNAVAQMARDAGPGGGSASVSVSASDIVAAAEAALEA